MKGKKTAMHRYLLLMISCFIGLGAHAQYTETINSNRPGNSQGAFAVGRDVFEVEAGPHFGQDKHDLTHTKTTIFGADYELRYGLFMEELEINLRGDFLFANQKYQMGGIEQSVSYSNFRQNTLGVKYLIYDPYKKRDLEGPNLYSWKANHGIHWRDLIPAISVYAGANLLFGDRPEAYPFFGDEDSGVSPQVAIITQNNWGPFVFVMNFIADRLTEDHKRYSGIFTLTHAVSQKFSVFGEFQFIKDDFYSDDLLRLGGAFLLSPDLQFDLSGLVNFKDTPGRWQIGAGVSYRLDMHSIDVKLDDGSESKMDKKMKKKAEKDQKKKDPAKNTKDNPGKLE